jgi:CarD family transcriptional regulator
LKSKSTGSKSSKATTTKTKSPSNVVRLGTKPSATRAKSSKPAPKLTAVKGAKATGSSSKAVVATKVSVTERLTSSRLVKKAEVITLSTKSSSLTLVQKTNSKVDAVIKVPATKISRSEPTSLGSKVITGKFSVENTPAVPVVATKMGADKVIAQQTQTSSTITFKTGDKIVYPGHGVGEIEGIRTTVLGGQEHHIYNIKILDSGMKVMVPVSQASAVGLRKIVDKKAIEEVFSILKDRDFKIDTQTWNRRFREYSQKIKTGSVFEIAVVLRDLLVLSADKELSFGEKKMLDTAEGLLVSEIAIAKARPHDKVVGELRALFA